VEERLTSHPQEAALADEHGIYPLCKATARPIDDYTPLFIVKMLLDAYPKAIWFKTNGGRTALAAACWRRASFDILQLLVRSRPSIPEDYVALQALWKSYLNVFGSQNELMDLICENGGSREGAMIWTKFHLLLRYCTSDQLVQPWRGLHTAASAPVCHLELFRIVMGKYPGEVRCADEHGCLPLHLLLSVSQSQGNDNSEDNDHDNEKEHAQKNRQARLKMLLQAYPEAARVKDALGRLPLHVAIESGWEDLSDLMEAHPDSLLERDGVFQLYPFQLAAWSPNASLSTAFTLLQRTPHVLEIAKQYDASNDGDDALTVCASEDTSRSDFAVQSLYWDNNESYACEKFESFLEELAATGDNTLWTQLNQLLRSEQRTDEPRRRVVHAAALSAKCPAGLLQIALRIHPEQARQFDEDGRLPLHIVCASACERQSDPEDDVDYPNVIQTKLDALLKVYPEAAKIRDRKGQLPLHLAAVASVQRGGIGVACLDRLLAARPDALCQRDGQNGLFPFLLAASNPSCGVTTIFQLLLAAPHVIQFCDL
jgi:ankyrin repeat protein